MDLINKISTWGRDLQILCTHDFLAPFLKEKDFNLKNLALSLFTMYTKRQVLKKS